VALLKNICGGGVARCGGGGTNWSGRIRWFIPLALLLCVAVVWWALAGGNDDGYTKDANPVAVERGSGRDTRGLRWVDNVATAAPTATPVSVAAPSPVFSVPDSAGDSDSGHGGAQPLAESESLIYEESTIASVVCSYSWDCETALAVFTCESGLRADAVSYDGTSYGVTQLHAPTWATVFAEFWSRWMDTAWNIARAWDIYVRAGYSFWPWSCAQ